MARDVATRETDGRTDRLLASVETDASCRASCVGVVRRIEVVDVRRSRDALEVRSIHFIHSIGRGWRARESERGRSGKTRRREKDARWCVDRSLGR